MKGVLNGFQGIHISSMNKAFIELTHRRGASRAVRHSTAGGSPGVQQAVVREWPPCSWGPGSHCSREPNVYIYLFQRAVLPLSAGFWIRTHILSTIHISNVWVLVITRARKIVTKFHNYSYEIVMSPVIVNSYKNGHNSYQIVFKKL